MNGDITALKSIFHRAIRDIACHVLDLSIVNFTEHPNICLNYINHDLTKQFVFSPLLRQNYVQEYLKESISNSRYHWHCYWKKHARKHPSCPIKRFPKLVKYWDTPEPEEESRRMRRARRRRNEELGSLQCDGVMENFVDDGRRTTNNDATDHVRFARYSAPGCSTDTFVNAGLGTAGF
jgi:hypothetical protein